jgi:hypothetical protein
MISSPSPGTDGPRLGAKTRLERRHLRLDGSPSRRLSRHPLAVKYGVPDRSMICSITE